MSPISDYFDSLPPGIAYIFYRLSKASVLPISVYLLSTVARNVFDLFIPTWFIIAAEIAVVPLALVVSINFETFNDRKAANALGAVMVPQVPSNRLGGLDVISDIEHADRIESVGTL